MKLVSYVEGGAISDPVQEMFARREARGQGGVLVGDRVYNLGSFIAWAGQTHGLELGKSVVTVLDFVQLEGDQRLGISRLARQMPEVGVVYYNLNEVRLRAPLETPPSVRDFYAFEQHVKAGRANRGLEMIPEWYQFPVFYFSNHRAIYGPDDLIPYPRYSQALDFELEIACVIGKAGRDIPAAEGPEYIAGYTIMNDWSARDLQLQEMKLNMGPVKGKDFATSLGPLLVTPDELEDRRVGEGAGERYDLTMLARLNGQEFSHGNFRDIYYSFPQMIERASLNTWLEPGDVLGSGTVGTGCIYELADKRERWLQAGDVLELEIEHLGVLKNEVVSTGEYPPSRPPAG